MANSKNVITKTDQVDLFSNNVRTLINNATVWYTGSPNLPGIMVGFPTSYLTAKDPSGPTTADLSSAAISATVLAQALQGWCLNYTRVRKFRFRRWSGMNGKAGLADYDNTQITALNNTFIQTAAATDINSAATSSNVVAGQLVTAANFNNFVAQLYNKWDAYKNNTETYTFVYCHNSCHSNCHSSNRIRR